MKARRPAQRGQAIVLVALVMVVMLGFVGLAVDGGHAYLDRREMQAAVDAAALAAAYNYMNTSSYAEAESAAMTVYAKNERLYMSATCGGFGSSSATCDFADATGHTVTVTTADRGIAGVTFTVRGSHRINVAVMQVLGTGTSFPVNASASALARRQGTNGAAIQTLSPACSGGVGTISLAFTGTSTTLVTGDIWSNGAITDAGGAGGSVNGNVVDVCPAMPPSALPTPSPWTVSGVQVNGWNMPDPSYAQPALSTIPQSWISANGSTEFPGTYGATVSLTSTACYFLAGGVYDFAGGFKLNGGFVSNELRPPDEPALTGAGIPLTTVTTAALSGSISSIPVAALPAAIAASTSQQNSYVSANGQSFAVSTAGANAGATSIPLKGNQSVTGTIASGSTVTVRAFNQFWDANKVGCSSSFSLSSPGSGSLSAGTYSVEVTAVRWEPNGIPTCAGPVSPTCYMRESAPSMCKTLAVASSGNLKVSVTADPGATDFKVYIASNGSCSGLTYCANLGNGNSSVTITNCPSGQPGPPDGEGVPVGPGLPNSDPPAGTPPRGDLANEGHCVDPSMGSDVACSTGYWVTGAVAFYVPGPGNNTQCFNLQGGGDVYVYSGYQYERILLYEPGPEQAPPPNTCPNNIAGNGFTSLIGIFYVPAAGITITGNSSYFATIAGGVIAWTVDVKGTGGVSISADPTLRKWPATVRLVQ